MPRAARSVAKRARHNKWLKRAKGFRGRRKASFKLAKEAVLKAGQHAYFDRRKKRTVARSRWHIAINASARKHDLSYSKLMAGLHKEGIELDRKVLAQIAKDHPEVFDQVVKQIKK
ncbi:MAG: 50S ribosomal protein L20 [Candidatus Andersenbacteria bacterium]